MRYHFALRAGPLRRRSVRRTETRAPKFDRFPPFRYSSHVSVNVPIPDDLAAQIDKIARDRAKFVEQAIRKLLGEAAIRTRDELARINEVADQLNEEAADVLEFQVIS